MIALNVFGPALKYRLDLLKDSSYDVRDKVHILTDRVSYEKFYYDFHDDYTWVFVEDYMSEYELSLKHEIIPNVFKNEEDHFVNSNSFYKKNNNFFSFDIHRFIFPYFISKGIKKFGENVLVESGPSIIDELLLSKALDGIYLSITSVTGGENPIDIAALLGNFVEIDRKDVEGTQFIEARRRK